MGFCTNCGSQIFEGHGRFCSNCGKSIAHEAAIEKDSQPTSIDTSSTKVINNKKIIYLVCLFFGIFALVVGGFFGARLLFQNDDTLGSIASTHLDPADSNMENATSSDLYNPTTNRIISGASREQQLVEDFLLQFPGLFQQHGRLDLSTGQFYDRVLTPHEGEWGTWYSTEWVQTADFPLFSIGGRWPAADDWSWWDFNYEDVFFDYTGRVVEQPSFITGSVDQWVWYNEWEGTIETGNSVTLHYQSSFILIDLDNDGIPEILFPTQPHLTFEGGWFTYNTIFRWINGAYRNIGGIDSSYFFFDTNGNTIVFFSDEQSYQKLTFTENSFSLEVLVTIDDDWHWVGEPWGDAYWQAYNEHFQQWWDHHEWPYWRNNPTIFGTGEPLTVIERMYDMHNAIIQNGLQRLLSGERATPSAPEDLQPPPRMGLGFSGSTIWDVGVRIDGFIMGSDAPSAGMQIGDIITTINSHTVHSIDGISIILRGKQRGDSVAVQVLRNNERLNFQVRIGHFDRYGNFIPPA